MNEKPPAVEDEDDAETEDDDDVTVSATVVAAGSLKALLPLKPPELVKPATAKQLSYALCQCEAHCE